MKALWPNEKPYACQIKNAQKDNQPNYKEIREDDKWQTEYLKNPIHELVKSS